MTEALFEFAERTLLPKHLRLLQWLLLRSRLPRSLRRRQTQDQRDAVFLWIPKSAGTSIVTLLEAQKLKSVEGVRYLFPGSGVAAFGHMDYRSLVDESLIPASFDASAFKFCFVRNPYARALSLWRYLQKIDRLGVREGFEAFLAGLMEDGCEPIGLYNSRRNSQCNPQVRWLEGVEVDFIGRVESIQRDYDLIAEKLGLRAGTVPMLNTTTGQSVSDAYSLEAKAMVDVIYAEDFERFGYPRELPAD